MIKTSIQSQYFHSDVNSCTCGLHLQLYCGTNTIPIQLQYFHSDVNNCTCGLHLQLYCGTNMKVLGFDTLLPLNPKEG